MLKKVSLLAMIAIIGASMPLSAKIVIESSDTAPFSDAELSAYYEQTTKFVLFDVTDIVGLSKDEITDYLTDSATCQAVNSRALAFFYNEAGSPLLADGYEVIYFGLHSISLADKLGTTVRSISYYAVLALPTSSRLELRSVATDTALTSIASSSSTPALSELSTDETLTSLNSDETLTSLNSDETLTSLNSDETLTSLNSGETLTSLNSDETLTSLNSGETLSELSTDELELYLAENNLTSLSGRYQTGYQLEFGASQLFIYTLQSYNDAEAPTFIDENNWHKDYLQQLSSYRALIETGYVLIDLELTTMTYYDDNKAEYRAILAK